MNLFRLLWSKIAIPLGVLTLAAGLTTAAVAEEKAPTAPAAPTQAAPTNVKVGMFVTQLYDLNFPQKAYNISFWAWFVHDNPNYKPLANVEVVNAKSQSSKFQSTTPSGKQLWAQARYSASIKQDWDVAKFPFDRQFLKVYMEDAQSDDNAISFVPDKENSRIDEAVKVDGWDIESFTIDAPKVVYNTTYGDPSLQGTSTYSRAVATITMKRKGFRILCSMFIGFFVSFGLACLSYFLDAKSMSGPRMTLCAGAIFASVGNKYVIDNALPPSPNFTLADAIQISTFGAILAAILVFVIIQNLGERGHKETAAKINRFAGRTIFFAYLLFLGANILSAM